MGAISWNVAPNAVMSTFPLWRPKIQREGKKRKHPSLRWKDNVSTLKTSFCRKRAIKMFLDTLSANVLQFCDARNWSYEDAAEHCDLSSRYFGDIARGKTAPSVKTLEKLCTGFQLLPNDLLLTSPVAIRELAFRVPLDVTQCLGYSGWFGLTTYPVCPKCQLTFEREYQEFCDRCGQKLCWKRYSKAKIILPGNQHV